MSRLACLAILMSLPGAPALAEGTATISVEGEPHKVTIDFASRLCGVPKAEVSERFAGTGKPVCDVSQETADISTYPGVEAVEIERKRAR